MAKKKKPSKRDEDQPELPLDGGADTPASENKGRKAEDGGRRAEDGGRKTEDGKQKADAPAAAEKPAQADEVIAAAPPPPPRRTGGKVQDESAPLAQHYRTWFLDYASYVILDRAVPHIDDG